jgi:hypothetical protein
MRWANSYSIVDHNILHGGYLHRLSHEAMALYLFLVVVGNRDGRSFYSDGTIMEIVRLDKGELNLARKELIGEGLIDYRRPYWQVKNISERNISTDEAQAVALHKERRPDGGAKREDTISSGCNGTKLLPDRRASGDYAKACIENISRILEGR